MKSATPAAGSGFNIAAYLPEMARRWPWKRALVFPESRDRSGRVAYTQLTFPQLDAEADRIARGLGQLGLGRGERVALMVRPSLDFVSVAFALFKMGAVPVFVDPGMGAASMLQCFREASPVAFIGIARAHLLRLLVPGAFRSVRIAVNVGGGLRLGTIPLEELAASSSPGSFPVADTGRDEIAAVFFTSGSTGAPKGVPFTHGMIRGQVELQQRMYSIGSDEVDLTAFPLFALFSTAFGITAVIPDMDPTKPAKVDPRRIVEAIRNHGVTHTFGSPAIWHRVGRYCDENRITLPSLHRILMAGAPVPPKLLERWRRILPNGEVFTPYGATECLGVASISATEVLEETWEGSCLGRGTCVGRVMPGMEVKVIPITDEPVELGAGGWDGLEAASGTVGEIAVRGPVAAREYLERPEDTRRSKIVDGDSFWHRMGDLGYFDEQGRLWFCGRKAHRVTRRGKPLFSVMVEGRFNSLEGIHRTALVGVPSREMGQAAVLIVEPDGASAPADRIAWQRELESRAREMELPIDQVLFHEGFPVDVRHNAKIRREELAVWAARKLGALQGPGP